MSTLGRERLTDLALMSIEKELLENLSCNPMHKFTENITAEFCLKNNANKFHI